ncbi:MAG: TSUP family transporter [Nitrospirota bacterium]|nr:TSUP family transporter [Nitrospirota bacterium]
MLPVLKFPLLFAAGLFAGLIDSIAGGGGLITIPVLLGIGMPPQTALGTNKLQGTFGAGSAMVHFARAGAVNLKECGAGILWTALGAGLGTAAVQGLDPAFLGRAIPLLLIAIALFILFSPRLGMEDVRERMDQRKFFLLFGISIGFYDGFFGPATGTFWAMAFVLFLGFNLARATAYTKVMNFTSNLVSLAFFFSNGLVSLPEGIVMGLGQFAGARFGSRLVIKKGSRFIRPVFITVVIAISVKLLWQNIR